MNKEAELEVEVDTRTAPKAAIKAILGIDVERDGGPGISGHEWVTEGPIDREEVMECAENIDWSKAHTHGGDPCFVVLHADRPDNSGTLQHIHRFCLRPRRWHTGPEFHDFMSLHEVFLALEPPEAPLADEGLQDV